LTLFGQLQRTRTVTLGIIAISSEQPGFFYQGMGVAGVHRQLQPILLARGFIAITILTAQLFFIQ
jgi:hypothetical protein